MTGQIDSYETTAQGEATLIEALGSVAQGTHVDHSTATPAEDPRSCR